MATLNTVPLLSLPQSPTAAILTVNNDRRNHHHPTLSLLHQCTNLNHLKQLHAHMLRQGLFFDTYSASRLLTAYALSSFSSLDYARKVFDQISLPNVYAWNTLIRALASSSEPIEGLWVFLQLLHEHPFLPNKYTFPFVVKASAGVKSLNIGQAIHGMVIKASFGSDVFISNALVYFYASCGDLESAYLVFDKIGEKDVASWNSMITGFVQGGYPEKALELFKWMEMENVRADDVTMVSVLSACAKKMDLEFGKWVCEYIERNGINATLNLNNAMLDMYVKNGSIDDASRLFDKMEEKDVVSWTTMIDGYANIMDFDAAKRVFDAMPRQEIAAWNVLISAYSQNGMPKEALTIFWELQHCKNAKPDEITLVSTLSACAQLGTMDLGEWIYVYIKKQGIKLNPYLTTSLIDMYSKCGNLKKALEVFYSVENREVSVWSAMIGGLAMHGQGRAAIDLFFKMQEARLKPNALTFTNLLSACSHAGLVEEGRMFLNQMESVYGVVPGTKHYASMVDILGRAGLLEEAMELIEKMPITPSTSVWGGLLGGCRIHGNVELAEKACNHILQIDPLNYGAYVLLSNIYAAKKEWDGVASLRKHMRVSGMKKEPGCSAIAINGNVHEFVVGDNSHPLSKEIYSKLNEDMAKLKSAGYV